MATDPKRGDALKVAMLAPPWIPIPPPAYGGIEEVVRLLSEGLVDAGHEVHLFAAPGSQSPAAVHEVLPQDHPDEIEKAKYEADHVARAFDALDAAAQAGEPFDVLHDHTGHTALAMAHRIATPMVHTLHGPFDDVACEFYAHHGDKAQIVAISQTQLAQAPPEITDGVVVHNPLRVAEWPFSADKEDWLLWIGRMSPDKGPDRAIEAAKRAGMRLVIAGPVQTGQEEYFKAEVEPHIDGEQILYHGEADAEGKRELYQRAMAVLMPIRWPEPFGLVMVEAMACGTPVIAFPEGAAQEIVLDGVNGFLVDDEEAMAEAARRVGDIEPERCRASIEERYDVPRVVEGYVDAYRRAMARQRTPAGAGG
jgi:glycosyltransferase involved in cell wall biosynthesis